MSYKNRNLFLIVLEAKKKCLKSNCQQILCLLRTCSLAWRQLSFCCVLSWQRNKRALLGLFYKGPNPIHRALPSRFNHTMGTPSNTITLEIEFQHMNFGGTQTCINSLDDSNAKANHSSNLWIVETSLYLIINPSPFY